MKILAQVSALSWILLVIVVLEGAHASTVETTTDLLDSTISKDSVVINWQTVCDHLYRINLSGSGCRPYYDSNAPPTNDSLPRNQLDLLCPTLCFNALGLPSCVCISPYKRVRGISRDGICRLFCSVTLAPLDGCSPCVDVETTTEMPTTTIKTTIPTTTTTRTTTTRPTTTTRSTKAPTQSTTPDWAKLCNALCQIGEGGILCNCDLPPFF
ncbi:serine proteinase stubble [Phlebotomus papatasi]|uniref:serine proteinase stubble n=1 Tax=Phlebotomus papatasi TaxID=29031 RepID=UPI002483F3A5|nr:serine proteinase stubble [Phlebotomus papatasi]